MTKLYGAVDLHSNSSVLVLIDLRDKVRFEKRLPNDVTYILETLRPYRSQLQGLAVASTFNWYWLVDALQEAGYQVHLVNTSAVKQYEGLKFTDDSSDARWLAHLLRLGTLPQGFIYPREERAVRDLLRKRAQMVRQRTTNLPSIGNLVQCNAGDSLAGEQIKQLTEAAVGEVLPETDLGLALKCNLRVMQCADEQAGGGVGASGAGAGETQARVQVPAHGAGCRADSGPDHHAGDRGYRALCKRRGLRLVLSVRRQQKVEQQQEGPRQSQERQPISGLGLCRGGELRAALRPDNSALLSAQAG